MLNSGEPKSSTNTSIILLSDLIFYSKQGLGHSHLDVLVINPTTKDWQYFSDQWRLPTK